jgi:hypothetical protein
MLIYLQREVEEKARQPETKLGAIAQTRHITRLRNAKQSRTKHPKPTHGARDRPKQGQPRAGRDRASGSGQRHALRRVATYAPERQRDALPKLSVAELPERPRDWHADIDSQRETEEKARQPETKCMLIYVLRDVLESKMQNGRQDRSPVIYVKAGTMLTGPMSKFDVGTCSTRSTLNDF